MIELKQDEPIFKLATLKDAKDISILRQRIWDYTYRGIYSDDTIDNFDFSFHIKKDIEKIKKPNFRVYFIIVNNTKAGYLIFSKEDPTLYKDFFICLNSLYILPKFQRKGIGSKSIKLVKDYCKINSINKFYNQCNAHNIEGINFYTRIGGTIGNEDLSNINKIEDTVWFEYYL